MAELPTMIRAEGDLEDIKRLFPFLVADPTSGLLAQRGASVYRNSDNEPREEFVISYIYVRDSTSVPSGWWIDVRMRKVN